MLVIALLAAVQVWIADESQKVRPQTPAPSSAKPRIKLAAAGGECTGAQIVVRGPARDLSASATGGLDLYRVATIVLDHPSGPEGEAGEWPDALIPVRDAVYGEARRAFPVDVEAGRNQSIFVEICVPRGAPAGRTAAEVKLSWRGGSQVVPVEIRKRAFDLPATPDLVTAFGFSGYSAAKGHGRRPDAGTGLTRAYDLAALRRGITLYGGTHDAPPMRNGKIDWTAYDAEVAPFLDGTALPSGAHWTSVDFRISRKLSRDERRAYRQQWVEHFRARGWLDRLFIYVRDEPSEKDFASVEADAREWKEDVPEVRRMVTTRPSSKLPSVDLWVPLINHGPAPRMWWYQSCMSHGCGPGGEAGPAVVEWTAKTAGEFRGWPSYMIDAPATAARAMGALAFANDVSGELYYDTVYAYDFMDPWVSQWAFAGNGDGTLFYPGTPERIGGKHDVPIESLRLVQISRSIADYGYLSLCARLGDPSLARAEAISVAPGLRMFSRDPRAYAAMRERLAARIESLASARKLGQR